MSFPSLVRYREAWQDPEVQPGAAGAGVRLSAILVLRDAGELGARAVREICALTRPFVLQVVVVDDGSTDGTRRALETIDDQRLTILAQPASGTAAAIALALPRVTGSHVVLFDPASGYDASSIAPLEAAVNEGASVVAYGAPGGGVRGALLAALRNAGGFIVTTFTNLVFDADLRDLFAGIRILPVDLLAEVGTQHSGYVFDADLAAQLLRRGIRPANAPCPLQPPKRRAMSLGELRRCLGAIVRIRRSGLIAMADPAAGAELDGAAPNGALATPATNGAPHTAAPPRAGTLPLGAARASRPPRPAQLLTHLRELRPADLLTKVTSIRPETVVAAARAPKNRWRIGVGGLIIIVTLLQFPGRSLVHALGISPPVQSFTELYFDHPTTLPTTLASGKPLSFSFVIDNQEGRSRTYDWTVEVETAARHLTLTAGTTTVAANHSGSVAIVVNTLHVVGSSTIEVLETSTNPVEHVDFHLTVTKAR